MDSDLSQFSEREKDIINSLVQGKSNKEIAYGLGIAERTVEFHLTHIYAKLEVRSRAEAILKLSESRQRDSTSSAPKNRFREIGKFLGRYRVLISIGTLLTVILILVILVLPGPWKPYEREGEYPDEHTVGQMIERQNASGLKVYGQFGAICCWPAQPGYVKYNNIRTPALDNLYVQLRYSKYSPSTVPILIYVDAEPNPRARLYPTDQGDWNKFAWTEPIFLGDIRDGVHSITFSTEGQQYGVADLDKFVLTAGPP